MNSNFILFKRLNTMLSNLLENIKNLPPVLCLYGGNGVGKTMFAKFLASQGAATKCVNIIDLTELKSTGLTHGSLLKKIDMNLKLGCLWQKEEHSYKHVIILDEFQLLSLKEQAYFTELFERRAKEHHCLFILCVNVFTDEGQTLKSVMHRSILNRVYPISFDAEGKEVLELKRLIINRYPDMPVDVIDDSLPSLRPIINYAKINGLTPHRSKAA